jgi:hypothetical protein
MAGVRASRIVGNAGEGFSGMSAAHPKTGLPEARVDRHAPDNLSPNIDKAL